MCFEPVLRMMIVISLGHLLSAKHVESTIRDRPSLMWQVSSFQYHSSKDELIYHSLYLSLSFWCFLTLEIWAGSWLNYAQHIAQQTHFIFMSFELVLRIAYDDCHFLRTPSECLARWEYRCDRPSLMRVVLIGVNSFPVFERKSNQKHTEHIVHMMTVTSLGHLLSA